MIYGKAKLHAKIIAFSGRKQSGKSTAIEFITKQLPLNTDWQILNFADYLKEIVLNCFCPDFLDLKDLDQMFGKNHQLDNGKTVREVLQYIGTDIFRSVDDKAWIQAYQRRLKRQSSFIFTSDVRFENELVAIQELGGKVIRLTRDIYPEDSHVSEGALDTIELNTIYNDDTFVPRFDYVINNMSMSIDEKNEHLLEIMKKESVL